ncbi:cysteine protease [Microbotryomycetes sp. JL221]|nr:cysteine protease [Microbotryomycetes sp. JL221]
MGSDIHVGETLFETEQYQPHEPPPLSSAQVAPKRRWQSLRQVLPNADMIKDDRTSEHAIVQDNVSDCSLVSALIVGAQHHRKFCSRDAQGLPTVSAETEYSARLLVNGTWRAVGIDDAVPVTDEGMPMCAMTEKRDQLWPALVEKAYLKVMGGYEFAGSLTGKAGTETFTLDWDQLPLYFDAAHLDESGFDEEVWLLLSRHISSKDVREFMSINVVTHSKTAFVRQPELETSTYQDNDHILFRFKPDRLLGSKYDVLISSQGDSSSAFAFSLRTFAPCPVELLEGPPPPSYSVQVEGAWDGKTAGGNHACPTFLQNPQYSLRLLPLAHKPRERARVELSAHTTGDSALPINVRLVRGGGQRIGDIEERDVAAGSSRYAYGADSATVDDLEAGAYTIVVSSFDPRVKGVFTLTCSASLPIEVKLIPQEGDGETTDTLKHREL